LIAFKDLLKNTPAAMTIWNGIEFFPPTTGVLIKSEKKEEKLETS
jgi:hypothetical protein